MKTLKEIFWGNLLEKSNYYTRRANRKGTVYAGKLIVGQTDEEFMEDLRKFFRESVGDSYPGLVKTFAEGDVRIAIAFHKEGTKRAEVYKKFGFTEERV